MGTPGQAIALVAKILLKTALNLVIGVATTAFMGFIAASGVGLAVTLVGIIGITIARNFFSAAVGAAVDTTVDYMAEQIKSRKAPIALKDESKRGWEYALGMLGSNVKGAMPWNDKDGWKRGMLWE